MKCSGSLFITDCLVTEYLQQHPSELAGLSPEVIFLSESPQFASLVSQQAMDEIVNKENEFTSIKPNVSSNGFQERNDKLLKSALALSHASYVAIVTPPPQEEAKQVSGRQLSAVVCIVKALLAQDKEITILTQKNAVAEWETFLAECESQSIVLKSVPVVPIAGKTSDWSRDVCSVMAMVVDNLGLRFSSSSLNSMVFVSEQGQNKSLSRWLTTNSSPTQTESEKCNISDGNEIFKPKYRKCREHMKMLFSITIKLL